jgi:cobalt-zinc-cadmium efflux system outer membrane protein
MRQFLRRASLAAFLVGSLASAACAQKALTWDEVRARFEANNPTLHAGQIGIDESKANEITAYLRPNPSLTIAADGTQLAPHDGIWKPVAGTFESVTASYLHERRHKRELRRDSAVQATEIAVSGQSDLERNLLFTLRGAFVGTLQAEAVLRVAVDNLKYWDQVLAISRDRFGAGDIAQIDLDRLELQRVQFEADVQTAEVNLRTSKIELLMLMNDRTPVEQFEVSGPFEYNDQLKSLEDFRQIALDHRPDLKAALLSVDQANTNHRLAEANGSTDPTLSAWYTHNGSYNNPLALETLGLSVGIPLRIFDRNQGEKLRTRLDIDRNQKMLDATRAQVFNDVDSAYAVVNSNLILLRPYKAKYLDQATRVRDTVRFSYEHGGAALLDFLNAENDYRSVQLNYVNLVGAYLIAASQLNLAIGQEVIE